MEEDAQPPPPPPYLRTFLRQEFNRVCHHGYYCFYCGGGFCSHCCRGHAARHHPGRRPAVAEVRHIGQSPAISAEDVKGVGYDWSRIQRIKHGRKYILLRRLPNPPIHQKPLLCSNCDDKMNSAALFCCASCRVEGVPNGRGRAMIQTLVATEFGDDYLADRFCTVCRSSFCSTSCVHHVEMHHADNLGHAQLILISRQHGWLLTPRNHGLPEHVVEHVQEVDVNGTVMVPILRKDEPADGDAGSLCLKCFQIIGEAFQYCSIQCKAADVWFI